MISYIKSRTAHCSGFYVRNHGFPCEYLCQGKGIVFVFSTTVILCEIYIYNLFSDNKMTYRKLRRINIIQDTINESGIIAQKFLLVKVSIY